MGRPRWLPVATPPSTTSPLLRGARHRASDGPAARRDGHDRQLLPQPVTVNTDIGWYVNTRHEGHANLSLDFVQRDHASSPDVLRGKRVAGTLLAFLVDYVDAEERRLREAGLDFVLSIATESWGQRRFQVTGPDGLVVEVLQMVPPDPDWLDAHGLAPN